MNAIRYPELQFYQLHAISARNGTLGCLDSVRRVRLPFRANGTKKSFAAHGQLAVLAAELG
jgi:hypothetical protein